MENQVLNFQSAVPGLFDVKMRPRQTNTYLYEEVLPFTVKIVRSESELRKALQLRQEAYSRHLPEFAATLHHAEVVDLAPGSVVLLAESKLDGSPIGTMRVQTNEFGPLAVEQSIKLPAAMSSRRLAEATRLGVTSAKVARIVKPALFKAFYQYSLLNNIDRMVIVGRAPIDRQYDRLLFTDVYPDTGFIPLQHVGGLPHRIMSLAVRAVEPLWTEENHYLCKFFFETHHPDIDLRSENELVIQ